MEAMEDFTGGVSEEFGLKDNADKRLFGMLKKAYDRDSQLGCSINAKPGVTEAKLPNGLICGHAYTITDLKRVTKNLILIYGVVICLFVILRCA